MPVCMCVHARQTRKGRAGTRREVCVCAMCRQLEQNTLPGEGQRDRTSGVRRARHASVKSKGAKGDERRARMEKNVKNIRKLHNSTLTFQFI